MRRSTRVRRDWQIIFWLSVGAAVLSVGFGYTIRQSPPLHAAMMSVAFSLVIGTPIIVFEVIGRRSAALSGLRRLPVLLYFGLSVLFYIVVIVVGLLLVRLVVDGSLSFDRTFRLSVIFAVTLSVLSNLTVGVGFLLGFGTLRRLLTGRYVHPRREEKTFLLIDMRDSTGVAERLGPIRFHALLNEFLNDIADAAVECGAEIHKYVGDEAILTWSGDAGLADGACLACPFVTLDFITAKSTHYRERYGVVPQFRAALHCGEIVTGEIGAIRREIAYVGDTLNVAARLLEATKELGRDVLVSADLLERATLPPDLKPEPLPMLTVRGRAAPLAIWALHRSAAAS